MAFPIIAAALGGSMGLASGLFNIGAAKRQAQALEQKALYEKDQALKSGQFLLFNARVTERQGERDVRMVQRSADFTKGQIEKERLSVKGSQRAQFAASGLDVHSGSAALAGIDSDLAARLDQSEVAYMAELDSVTIKNNAWRTAYGYKLEAESLKEQADFNLAAARAAGKAGVNEATISTFLSVLKGGLQGAQSASGIVAGAPSGGMTVPKSSFSHGNMGGGTGASGFGKAGYR